MSSKTCLFSQTFKQNDGCRLFYCNSESSELLFLLFFSFHCSHFFNISYPGSSRIGQRLIDMNNWNFSEFSNCAQSVGSSVHTSETTVSNKQYWSPQKNSKLFKEKLLWFFFHRCIWSICVDCFSFTVCLPFRM